MGQQAALGRRPVMSAFQILDWGTLAKNSLRGFAKVEMLSGMIISEVAVMVSERGPWASPPSKPMIGRDGVQMKDDTGKARYSPVVELKSKGLRNRWSDAVIAALTAAQPDVLK